MKADPASPVRALTPARLRAVMQVAETGSYAAAARRLGQSHAAVSQAIRALEAAQGLRLFDRVGGLLRPTPVALELCEIGERIRDAEREADRVLARRDPAGNRLLRVGLGNSMPGIALIGAVLAQHRGLSVTVVTGAHNEIMAAVLRRDVEVAVLPDVPPDPRFRRAAILRHEVVAIVSATHPMAGAETATLDDLAREPLVFRARGSSTQKVVDRAFRRAGLAPEPVLVADTRDAVYEAVAVGIGVGFMWRNGTFRSDTVRRIAVAAFQPASEECVFALSDERNPVVDLFFAAAETWRAR